MTDFSYDASRHLKKGRGKVYDSIVDTIGDTPIVRLPRLSAEYDTKATVLAKLEFFNPIASVKDRIGVAMVEALQEAGKIDQDTVLIEPTSGNTGIALAFVAAAKGLKLTLCMPESMSIERRKMLALLGARLELTPAEKGMKGAIARAQELLETTPNSISPSQFENLANPAIHRVTTAEEIWNDTAGAGGHRRRRRRHRRHHLGRGPGAEGQEGVGAVHRRRARGLSSAVRRRARPAQDPGHRRRLRARHL